MVDLLISLNNKPWSHTVKYPSDRATQYYIFV